MLQDAAGKFALLESPAAAAEGILLQDARVGFSDQEEYVNFLDGVIAVLLCVVREENHKSI